MLQNVHVSKKRLKCTRATVLWSPCLLEEGLLKTSQTRTQNRFKSEWTGIQSVSKVRRRCLKYLCPLQNKNTNHCIQFLKRSQQIKHRLHLTDTWQKTMQGQFYSHVLLWGIILSSLSHASRTWLIKFHSGARCNYTHAHTHKQKTHTHTHKNSICVISDVAFQNHILQQIEIGCVGKAEGLEDSHFVLVRIPPRCSWPERLFPGLWRSKRRCACRPRL